MYLIVLVWKNRFKFYSDSWQVANDLARYTGTWKTQDGRGAWGRGMCLDSPHGPCIVSILVSYKSTRRKVLKTLDERSSVS